MPLNIKLHAVRLHFNTIGRIAPRRAGQLAMQLFSTPRYKPAIKPEYQRAVDTAQPQTIEVHGHTLQGYFWDNGGDKLALLLHGWESRAARMSVLLPVLKALGYNALALDAPAHGTSSGARIHVPLYGNIVAELAARYQPTLICGHSMGALAAVYAITYLQAAPSVEKLVLFAAATDPEWMMNNAIDILKLPAPVIRAFTAELTSITGLPIQEFTMHRLVAKYPPRPKALFLHAPDDAIALFSGVEAAVSAWGNHATLLSQPEKGHSRIVGAKSSLAAMHDFLASA